MAQMIDKQRRIAIGFLLILAAFAGCNPAKKIYRNAARAEKKGFWIDPMIDMDGFNRDKIISYYLYQKYINGEKTKRASITAVGIEPGGGGYVTRLKVTDYWDISYKRPVFITEKFLQLKDSCLAMLWGIVYKEVMIDFKANIGDTLYSQVSRGWIYRKKSSYLGYPLYEMVYAKDPRQKIQYVHNLGFILDEYTYEDSVISWKLESIDGMPVDSFVINSPDYQYIYGK